jgi:hypothetical protein
LNYSDKQSKAELEFEDFTHDGNVGAIPGEPVIIPTYSEYIDPDADDVVVESTPESTPEEPPEVKNNIIHKQYPHN